MDQNDPEFMRWLQYCEAALAVIRRRLKDNDGLVGHSVIKSLNIFPVPKTRRQKPAKKTSSLVPPRHIRIMQQYAQGKNLAEIAHEEKSNPGAMMRILRTAPFKVLQLCGIIKTES